MAVEVPMDLGLNSKVIKKWQQNTVLIFYLRKISAPNNAAWVIEVNPSIAHK